MTHDFPLKILMNFSLEYEFVKTNRFPVVMDKDRGSLMGNVVNLNKKCSCV